jgi:hypothetical protein
MSCFGQIDKIFVGSQFLTILRNRQKSQLTDWVVHNAIFPVNPNFYDCHNHLNY